MRLKDAYKGKRRGLSEYTLNCSRGFYNTSESRETASPSS